MFTRGRSGVVGGRLLSISRALLRVLYGRDWGGEALRHLPYPFRDFFFPSFSARLRDIGRGECSRALHPAFRRDGPVRSTLDQPVS